MGRMGEQEVAKAAVFLASDIPVLSRHPTVSMAVESSLISGRGAAETVIPETPYARVHARLD